MNQDHNKLKIKAEQFIENVQLSVNTDTEMIIITEAKLELILRDYEEKKLLKKSWLQPLTFFLTLVIVLVTVEFKDCYTLSKYTWKAIFILLTLMSFGWLIYTLSRTLRMKNAISLQSLIKQIKNHSP